MGFTEQNFSDETSPSNLMLWHNHELAELLRTIPFHHEILLSTVSTDMLLSKRNVSTVTLGQEKWLPDPLWHRRLVVTLHCPRCSSATTATNTNRHGNTRQVMFLPFPPHSEVGWDDFRSSVSNFRSFTDFLLLWRWNGQPHPNENLTRIWRNAFESHGAVACVETTSHHNCPSEWNILLITLQNDARLTLILDSLCCLTHFCITIPNKRKTASTSFTSFVSFPT